MANSRKPALSDPRCERVSSALQHWLNNQQAGCVLRTDSDAGAQNAPHSCIAVAFSGGRDSTVLLHALAQLLGCSAPSRLVALHVNHGLQTEAASWQQHCREFCAQLSIPFFTRDVVVPRDTGLGIEGAARTARYAALVELAQQSDSELLVTAHHADDQVESVLLQLLRGTGLPGAAGMAASKPVLNSDFPQQRPLLNVPAAALAAYAAEHQLRWIEDPSNQNTHYARNALRHSVLPPLQKHFPDYRNTLTRFASHATQAQELLDELAQLDALSCKSGAGGVDTKQLLQLSPARQTNLLRYWLNLHHRAAPSEARLHEIMRRLKDTKQVRAWSVAHDDHEIRFEYDVLSLRQTVASAAVQEVIDFRWEGEDVVAMLAWGGSWHFIPAKEGIDAEWLRRQILSTRPRQGDAKLKLGLKRPSRSLKNLYQEAQIPHDQRVRLPLLYLQEDLLAAAGIGMNCRFATSGPNRVAIVWKVWKTT